MPSRALRKT